jgi:hypothetical protein
VIVNLYVDHLMSPPPSSAEEVWNAMRQNPKVFRAAAQRVGLTDAQYREFGNALLDGKAVYVKLPRRMDAMSGERNGSVYAVKNAVMTSSVMGWEATLADGTQVYVPQVCGNISVLRQPRIAHAQVHHFVPSVATVPRPPDTPVALTPPEAAVPVAAPAVASEAVVPAASHGVGAWPLLIPAAIGGIWAGVSHGSAPPPCSGGSNVSGACTK